MRENIEAYEVMRNIDAYSIQKYQQNRYPLLFIDYVQEVLPGKYAEGFKNFSYNEWFFPAHFEDEPNVPGFVQLEALTQMFLMTFLTLRGNEGKKTAFVSANVKYKKKIIPGDRMDIRAQLDFYKGGVAKGKSVGMVESEVAVTAELVIAIPDILNTLKPKV